MSDLLFAKRWIAAIGMALTTTAALTTAAPVDSHQISADTSSRTASYGRRVFRCPIKIERMLPGYYYSCRGLYYLQHHKVRVAISKLKEAARWADKRAQYALGLIYFNGDVDGVPADRALGLAWLRLAAERQNLNYTQTYAVALSRSSPDEQARANHLWRELSRQYSDKVVGPRAVTLYNRAVKELVAMSLGSEGVVQVQGFMRESANSKHQMDYLDHIAETTFGGMQGVVTVGDPGRSDTKSALPTSIPAHPPEAPAQ